MRARTPARLIASVQRRRALHSTSLLAQTTQADASSSSSAPSSSTDPSSTSTFKWRPTLTPGSSEVYDAALAYLSAHRQTCQAQIDRLRALPDPTPEQRMEIDKREVDGYVNDPETRAVFKKTGGRGMMDRAVMRHLAERVWRFDGGLDLIMGRVYQNKIVPDVIPDLAPVLPLSVEVVKPVVEQEAEEGKGDKKAKTKPAALDSNTTASSHGLSSVGVPPGELVEAVELEQPPILTFQPFQQPSHPTTSDPYPSAQYTLVGLDADIPDPTNHTYTQRLHYLKTDIPLSVLSGQTDIIRSAPGRELVSYEPPAPAQHTGRHRLTWVLLRQIDSSAITFAPARGDFSLRSLMATFGFALNSIAAVNLVRTEWTENSAEHIDKIWRSFHGRVKAPVFRPVKHEVVFSKPRSAVGVKADELRERAYERRVGEYQRELEEALQGEQGVKIRDMAAKEE